MFEAYTTGPKVPPDEFAILYNTECDTNLVDIYIQGHYAPVFMMIKYVDQRNIGFDVIDCNIICEHITRIDLVRRWFDTINTTSIEAETVSTDLVNELLYRNRALDPSHERYSDDDLKFYFTRSYCIRLCRQLLRA